MGSSGGGGGSTTQKLDPAQREILLDSYNFTKDVASRPWEGYEGDTVAGFSPAQRLAHQQYANFGLSNMGGEQMQAAQGASAGAMNYGPANAQPWMSEYTDQVVDTAMGDLERQRQMQMQGIGDQAAAASAFGGSRHGLVEAETNRAFADTAAQTSANLREQGYNQALQAAAQGQQLNMLGAQQLADLSGEERRRFLEGTTALEGVGAQEQAMQQALMDDAYGRYMAEWNYPIQQAQLLQSGAGQVNLGGSTTQDPGSPNRLAGAAGGAMMGAQMGSVVPGIGTGVGAVVGGIGGAILSDRDSKEQINPADPEQALRGIQQMPVSEWQYKGDNQRHVGPMAQDVRANLGFGNGRQIPLVDAIGSQFAATKALADKVDRLERRKR